MIVGIDIGTQSLKTVVTDTNLRVLGESSRGYGVTHPQPGWAEQNPSDWESALRPAIEESLARAGGSPRDVDALGIVGQLDGCVPVGADGLASAPCIIWMDRRAEREIEEISAERVRRITGNCLDAGHAAAKMRWLQENLPAGVCSVFHQPVSYLVFRLTGEHVMDYGLASTSMLFSLAEKKYDDDLLADFGIDVKKLPRVASGTDIAGCLNAAGASMCGLPSGTPVAVGTGDDFSTPLGAGLIAPGRVACVLGTAEVVGAPDAAPKLDFRGLVETHCYVNGHYFIENPGWMSGGAIAWFVRTFGLKDVHELERIAGEVKAGAEGVIFIPALSGAMAPEWSASARGCFYGLTSSHGTGHLARAVLEGCAFAMMDVVSRLREIGVVTESVLLLGGGARSKLWAQIRADVSGLPMEIPERVDTSQIGAAMLAAVACGAQPDLAACARHVSCTATTIQPVMLNQDTYCLTYKRYRRLFDCIKPMF